MTKIEKIEDLLQGIEADVHNRLLKNILSELADFAKDPNGVEADEVAGVHAAIEIIKNNFYPK